MGQRLIVEFIYRGKTVAGLYQHWSAFTLDAFDTLTCLIGMYTWKKPQNEKQAVLQAMTMMSNIEGVQWDGYAPSERESTNENNSWVYIRNHFKGDDEESKAMQKLSERFCIEGDRSVGLAFAGVSAENCLDYGEASIAINLEDQTINFDVLNNYDGVSEYVGCYGSNSPKPSRLILPDGKYIDFFKYDDIGYMSSVFEKLADGYMYFAPNVGYGEGTIFGAIA